MKQRGMTLVSLMVGMLISILCMVALLMLFRTIIKTSVESRIISQRDAQIQNAFAAVQMPLQNAGFGFAESSEATVATIPNFIKKKGSTDTLALVDANGVNISNITINDALLWRYNDINIDTYSGTEVCQGLADITDSNSNRKLVLLKTHSNGNACNSTYSNLKWQVDNTLSTLPNGVNVTISEPSLITCTPYGVGIIGEHPLVTISAVVTNPPQSFDFPVCLSNITKTS